MWHTYDQRMYMISMNIHECGHVSFDFVLCACWIVVIRRTLFSLKWDSSKCCRGNMRHVMTWIKSWSNHLTNRYHTSMWFTSMYMTSQFYFRPNTSPTLVHQVMPHFRIKWCIHFVFPFFSVTLRVSTMAMLQVQPDLQALLSPFSRPNVNWHGFMRSFAKLMTWVTTPTTIICEKHHCTYFKFANVSVQSSLTSSWDSPSRWFN